MAEKQEFLYALKEQADTFRSWLKDVGAEIGKLKEELSTLSGRRRASIDTVAERLLPDLSDATLDALAMVLPGVFTKSEVAKELADEKEQIGECIKLVLVVYNPATSEKEALGLQAAIKEQQESRDILVGGMERFTKTENFMQLIRVGYGTSKYPYRWWNIQFYWDWRDSDMILEGLGKKNWAEVLTAFKELSASANEADSTLAGLKKKLDVLLKDGEQLVELQSELLNVPETVREKLLVQLRARIDTLTDSPELLAEIYEIDAKAAEFNKELNDVLYPRREKIQKDLAKVTEIMGSVSKSRLRSVPDEYLQQVRASNAAITQRTYGRGGYSGVQVAPAWRDDSLLETLLWYDIVSNHYHSDTRVIHENFYPAGSPQQGSSHASEESYGRVS